MVLLRCLLVFSLALTALAALLHLTGDQRPMLPWIAGALVQLTKAYDSGSWAFWRRRS